MMGPRSMGMGMGAGTPRQGPAALALAGGQRPHKNDDRDLYDTIHPYGGIELEPEMAQAAPAQSQVQLTPAQRLIERYERLSTPPPPTPPPHTPPHTNGHGHGRGQMMREKSTQKRQYVYDYRNNNSSLATPEYGRSAHGNMHNNTTVNGNGNGNSKRGLGYLKKDRSPIRQSLKNLFSAFKKGAGGLTLTKRGKGEDLSLRDGSRVYASEEGLRVNAGAQKLSNTTTAAAAAAPSRPPRKKMTGSLLYLSRTPPQPHTPDIAGALAWFTCSVTLEESKLVVSSFTGDMELYVHEIALARCADIRSLGGGQLSVEEARLLEEMGPEGEKMRVFEMVFADGRERERFASKSVRERAGWISAIWDAILPNQDVYGQEAGENTKEAINATSKQNESTTLDSRKRPIESPTPTPLPKLSSLLTPSYSDRSLPALPPKSPNTADLQSNSKPTDKPPQPHSVLPLNLPTIAPLVTPKKQPNLHLDLSQFEGPISPPSLYSPTVNQSPGVASHNDVVISPSIYPPTAMTARPVSTFVGSPISPGSGFSGSSSSGGGAGSGAGSGSGSAPNSPSIRNLSQLSVVRQRLAQIQRNHSQLSGESRYSIDRGGASNPTSTAHLRAAAARSSGTTPSTSPISPVGSGWSKSEAVFYRRGGKARKEEDGDGRVASPLSGKVGSRDSVFEKKHKEEQAEEQDGRRDGVNSKTRPRANSHRESLSTLTTPVKAKAAEGPSKEDIRKLSKEISGIKNVLGGESGCSTVHEMVLNLEQRMRGEKKDLRAIKDELKVLGERVSEAIATNVNVAARIEAVNANANALAVTAVPGAQSPNITNEASKKDDQAIIQALNEVKDRLAVEFPALAGKVQDIKDAQEKEKERDRENKVTTLSNVAPSAASSSSPPVSSEDATKAAADHKMLLEKLEEIRSLCQAPPLSTPPVAKAGKEEDANLTETLTKILGLIQEDSNKQTLLSQQQGDSVRYLNELNTWLEAFVNNGTSQIQGISNNIERLCNEIGCSPSSGQVAGAAGNRPPGPQPNLVNDIRQLVAGMKARDQNFAALQAAVHSLLEVLSASQTQKGADSQAIAGLMDRQRHDQEAMFRAFTNEISGEIKGERLRFVDAMKEATAINVQLHVEQFKQELSKEVMAMTEEVGRLHREKQLVENQISDLFSFYSKHKQAEMPLQVIPTNTGMPMRHIAQEAPRPNIPRSTRQRALPTYPRQQ